MRFAGYALVAIGTTLEGSADRCGLEEGAVV